jgi:hypothetical protein
MSGQAMPLSAYDRRSEQRSDDGQMILQAVATAQKPSLTCDFVEPPYGIEP